MEKEFDSLYPPKPFLEKEEQRRGHIAVTVFSMVLFTVTFLFFFDNQIWFVTELVGVLLLHELGHFLMMKRFGYENVRMLFIPLMGAFVHGKKDTYKQKESILVILAGPLPGIALAAGLLIIGKNSGQDWMLQTALISFVLNVMNLIPILPLDGGRLLNVLFFQRAEFFQVVFAFISSMTLIAVGLYFKEYFVMIFGFLMGIQVRSRHRRYLVHKSLRNSQVEYTTTYENLTDRTYHFIRKEVLEHTPGLRRFIENTEESESAPIVAGEVNNILEPPQEQDASIFFIGFVTLVWLVSIIVPILLIYLSQTEIFNAFSNW